MRDPLPPPVERKIQNADKYSCNGQKSSRDIGIDEFVQVMEKEPALIGLDAGVGFKPVLQQS